MTPRDRRALLVGAGVVAAAVVALRVIPWMAGSVGQMRERALERAETVARAKELIAEAPARRDSLSRALAAIVALAPKIVDGRSAAEAGASLSALVEFAASRHALKVTRIDPQPDSAAGVFGRVAVHAELEGDVAGLARFVRAMETGDPLLTVETLSIQVSDPSSRTFEMLRIELDVAGLYLPRGPR